MVEVKSNTDITPERRDLVDGLMKRVVPGLNAPAPEIAAPALPPDMAVAEAPPDTPPPPPGT